MISGLVLKYLNGKCFVIRQAYETTLLASTEFNLTVPVISLIGVPHRSLNPRISPNEEL
jgi:hypothetical protein